MIFTTIKIIGKIATVVTVATTSYNIYKKGKNTLGLYKKSQETKNKAKRVVNALKEVIKKK
jgi:hypothetical protein